jgi:pyruvate dehydrogenase E1 component beta subunit
MDSKFVMSSVSPVSMDDTRDRRKNQGDRRRPELAPAEVERTYAEAIRDAIAEEMRRDGDVFVIGHSVGVGGSGAVATEGLTEEFGERRVVRTPSLEAGVAGLAIGAAFAGLRPIVELTSWVSAMPAIEQIVGSAAKAPYMSGGHVACPIVFRGPNGWVPGGAQQAHCVAAWVAHVPGLKVVAPSSAADAKGLLKAAVRDTSPVLVLEHETLYRQRGLIPTCPDRTIGLGSAAVVRAGRHVTIVSYSRTVSYALGAADIVAKRGIEAEVVDLRSLRPIDWPTIIASVKRTNRIVVVEEGWPVCSIGSEICAQVAMQVFDYLDAPPTKVSGADVPMPYAANLEKLALPSVEQVVAAVEKVCYAT